MIYYDFKASFLLSKFVNYRAALKDYEKERILFPAVPKNIYDDFFQRPFIKKMIEIERLKLVIYEPGEKKITKWIK